MHVSYKHVSNNKKEQEFSLSQKIKIPRDVNEAIELLEVDCPDSLKSTIKMTNNDSLIYLLYPWKGDYETISNWTSSYSSKRKTKLEKHYFK